MMVAATSENHSPCGVTVCKTMLAAQPLRPARDQASVRLRNRPLAVRTKPTSRNPTAKCIATALGADSVVPGLSITFNTTAHTNNMAPDQPETRKAPERSSTAPIAEASTTSAADDTN